MNLPPLLAQGRDILTQSARARSVFLYVILVLMLVAARLFPIGEIDEKVGLERKTFETSVMMALERWAFDVQMNLLRETSPRPLTDDIVLIGMDEATDLSIEEPFALWHKHFALLFKGLAAAQPKAVGVDATLPERSYNNLIGGADNALALSIFNLRKSGVLVVYAETVDEQGRRARLLPIYARVLGEAGLGMDQQLLDPDRVSRRFSEREAGAGTPVPMLAGQLLRGLGRPVEEGHIDYSIGSKVKYLPLKEVLTWIREGNEQKLAEHFAGRIVLVGTVLTRTDRWDLPVKLVDWESLGGAKELNQPGVIVHLQVLRSHLSGGLLQPMHEAWRWVLLLAVALVVLTRWPARWVVAGSAALTAVLLLSSLMLIRQAHLLAPLASVVGTLWLAIVMRTMLHAAESTVERTRLKRSFEGQVSPAVLNEIMIGELAPGSDARTVDVCVIFSDIRGFTTLTEAMSPDVVMSVLTRYFDRMVKSVHRFDGTIDKFIGDGMMILFGAPRATPDPCSDGVRCALDMLDELDKLNIEFERDNLPRLQIGIGINYGKVVVGNIGSSERHNYSAIGDAVNVAARIEGQTKELGRRILITESVVNRIGDRFSFEALGERLVKGHSPVKVWGIRATRSSRTAEPEQGEDGSPAVQATGGQS